MLGKKPNKIYDPFLKFRLGYQNPERLKKAYRAQPKLYDGECLYSTRLKINSPDEEETLEGAEESRLKTSDKMIQINYEKLNSLYETFVPQQELSTEQQYFTIPNASTEPFVTSDDKTELQTPKMPTQSKFKQMFVQMDREIYALQTKVDKTLLKDVQRVYISDSQNNLREFYKTDVIPMSNHLIEHLRDIQLELAKEFRKC
ncbi:hypothetical protein Tco_0002255 [Tanacetum coccineum]